MRLADFIDDVARAMGFISRIPMPDRFFVGYDGRMSRVVRAFPVAGLLIGLPVAIMIALLIRVHAETLLMAALAIGLQSLLTGGLHEDGLADSADGIGSGRDRARALDIMKDSRIGAHGALALIITLLIRVAALAGLAASLGPLAAGLAWLAVSCLSRTAMVSHWHRLPPARADGVAASVGQPDGNAVWMAEISGYGAAFLLLIASTGIFATIGAFFLVALVLWRFHRLVFAKLGGHTGDTIGATQQISEAALLCGLALLT